MRNTILVLGLLAGCAANPDPPPSDTGVDMATDVGDAADAALDATVDGESEDASDANPDTFDAMEWDAEVDAFDAFDARADAFDAGVDAAPGCGPSGGDTITLDGTDDLSEYPSTQRLDPGGMVGVDEFAITWDAEYLYITLRSPVFAAEFKPLHVYLEAGSALAAASASTGKEYSAETAELPFSATHLLALRRTSVGGDGIAYNGIYTPTGDWMTMPREFSTGSDAYTNAGEVSVRVAWTDLGCPLALRLTAHVVNAVVSEEWKDFLPLSATPWLAPGGGYFEIDLMMDPAVVRWTEITP